MYSQFMMHGKKNIKLICMVQDSPLYTCFEVYLSTSCLWWQWRREILGLRRNGGYLLSHLYITLSLFADKLSCLRLWR